MSGEKNKLKMNIYRAHVVEWRVILSLECESFLTRFELDILLLTPFLTGFFTRFLTLELVYLDDVFNRADGFPPSSYLFTIHQGWLQEFPDAGTKVPDRGAKV